MRSYYPIELGVQCGSSRCFLKLQSIVYGQWQRAWQKIHPLLHPSRTDYAKQHPGSQEGRTQPRIILSERKRLARH